MREYYSVLGISKYATEAEIINAYRKLAAKFHPDANGNDPFFTERYRELQDAYNNLINPVKRAAYDSSLDPKFAEPSQLLKDKEKPLVTVFEASKKAISEDEPITLRWQTIHTTDVIIDFIGKVETEGTKILRLPFGDNQSLKISIRANNSYINESVEKIIEIKNKDFNNRQEEIKLASDRSGHEQNSEKTVEHEIKLKPSESNEYSKRNPKEKTKKQSNATQKKERALSKEEILSGLKVAYEDDSQSKSFKLRDLYVYIVLIVLLVFVIIMAIFAYSLNPVL